MDTKARALLTQQWLSVDIQNEEDLELAFGLAIDLRGEPKRWVITGSGIILLTNDSENPSYHPFPETPDAKELTRQFWAKTKSHSYGVEDVVARVEIPRLPDMGGLGGWSVIQMLFWTERPLCLVRFNSEM